jgi:hypothetical protein
MSIFSITDKRIAEYFNITTQTLRNWKKSNDERLNNRYKAFREFLIKDMEKCLNNSDLCFSNQFTKEQAEYNWNFKKANHDSDLIKSWLLSFNPSVNWIDNYYLKGINPFLVIDNGKEIFINFKDVMHPTLNKEVIILSFCNEKELIMTEKERSK